VATLTERMHRDERLRRLFAILENQTKALDALDKVLEGTYPPENQWVDNALFLRVRLAQEVVQVCQDIWDMSALDGEEPVNV
jgi:hypothetical protein